MEKRITEDIPILGKVFVNFLSLSTKMMNLYEKEDEINRQKNTAHLGLISTAFSGIKHTRYDYLILQCVISELAENNFKGTTSAQGNITINGKSYFGNDVIKTWFLMSNFGHCKNTIGDEKALLIKAIQHKSSKKKLINQVRDNDLKLWAEEVIENFDYVKFHHILAIRRIYKCLPRRMALQKELISVYKLLLLTTDKTLSIANPLQVTQLKSIHKNIRELAQISLDIRNSYLPFNIDILSTVLSFDFFENRFEQSKISSIFNPMLSMLYDTLYLDKKSQLFQRSYELRAIEACDKNYLSNIDTAIIEGLSNENDCNLDHFVRLGLNIMNVEISDLKDCLRSALTVKRGVPFAEASVDQNPLTSFRVMDFYINPKLFDLKLFPRFLNNIANILDKQSIGTAKNFVKQRKYYIDSLKEGVKNLNLNTKDSETIFKPIKDRFLEEVIDEIKLKNIPAFKGILWSVLRMHLGNNYYFDIDHHISNEHNYFGIKDNEQDYLTDEINKAISGTTDKDRKHELKQLLKSISRKFDGYIIACLQRITIYDYSKAPNQRKVTDIDSLVLKFNNQSMFLELHESKNTSNPFRDAKKDLKKKLIKTLSPISSKYRIAEIKGMGAKIVIKHKA